MFSVWLFGVVLVCFVGFPFVLVGSVFLVCSGVVRFGRFKQQRFVFLWISHGRVTFCSGAVWFVVVG